MAKGYWIARIDVHNMDGYKDYIAQNGAIFKKFGAKFLVRGGPHEVKEGTPRSRNVVIEFPDYETALACYNSPEYARQVAIRSRIRTPISSSSRAMTARSPELKPGLLGCRNSPRPL